MFSISEDTHHSNKLDLVVSNIKEKTTKNSLRIAIYIAVYV